MIDESAPDPAAIAARLQQPNLPPVHAWNPAVSGEIDIRIGRDGVWHYQGSPITRRRMVRLFSTVLRHDADGRFYLVTPAEKLAIRVDDAPFLAVAMTAHGADEDQVLVFRTNVDEEIMAGTDHPIWVETDSATGEPSPYIRVRDRLDALIARPVFYDLVELSRTATANGEEKLGVWSAGAFFPIGDPADPEQA